MAKGVRQRCRLFLEGREVPFVGATIIATVGSPKYATIDLVPHDSIKFIKPKTQVHIFVQDALAFGDPDFYLAFEGEVIGRAMMKSDGSRSFQITASSYLSYIEEAKVHCMNAQYNVAKIENTLTGAPPAQTEIKAAAALSLTSTTTAFSAMISIILSKGNKDLVAGIAQVLKKVSNVNAFYALAYSRLRIADRVKIFSSNNLAAFMRELNIEEFLYNMSGVNGGMNGLMDLLRQIAGTIFHEIIDVPFPSQILQDDAKPDLGSTIGDILFIPDNYSLPPPKCNVIFPSQQISFEFRDDFRSAPTRYMFRAQMAQFIAQEITPGATTSNSTLMTYPAMFYPDAFSDYMFSNHKNRDNKDKGLLGPATLISGGTRTYADVFYGQTSSSSASIGVGGISMSPRLRESDFLTNDEAVRGIFLEEQMYPPGVTALARGSKVVSQQTFFKEIGKFLFFKSRFQSRNAHAMLRFNPFLVPGFNCMLVDDSDAGQTFIGKLQSVSHRLTNESCATTIDIGYCRNFDEVDALTGDAGDPPTPAWFDKKVFGSSGTQAERDLFTQETSYLSKLSGIGVITNDEVQARLKIQNATVFPNISTFFKSVLGCESVTDRGSDVNIVADANNQYKVKSALVTPRGAASYIIHTYNQLSNSEDARDAFVAKYTRRPLWRMADAMFFLGADTSTAAFFAGKLGSQLIPNEFAMFSAVTDGPRKGRFDGLGYGDKDQIAYRRNVIDAYVEVIKKQKGFRG